MAHGVRRGDEVGTSGRALLVLVSAGLHALAFPPWGLSALAWVVLVPFVRALDGVGPGAALLLGLLWGTAAIWGVGYWVPLAFADYYQQPLWFGVLFALGASVVFAGSYTAGFAATARLVGARTRGAPRVVLLAAVWVAWELARARLLTGDPWLLLGYALVPWTTMIQVADLGGVYALSFLVALVNVALVEVLRARARGPAAAVRALAPAALAVLGAWAYGLTALATPAPASRAATITVVQGNNDLGTQWREEFYGEGLNEYLRMSYEAAARSEPDLLVWPESAVTFFLAHEERYRQGIARVLDAVDADLLLGAPHHDGTDGAPRYFNSAFYVTSDGRIRDRYDKTHLLPFAEYFPLRTIEFLRRRFERVRYFTPGTAPRPLETALGKVATVICFEGIFPEIVRRQMVAGAVLLVNLSNDAWLGRGAGPEQHLAMVVLRAVEHRVWVVRATTSGVSAFVDPHGRITGRTATFVPAVLEQEVRPASVPTFYKRRGDVFAYACLAVAIAAALGAWRAGRNMARAKAAHERSGPAAAPPARVASQSPRSSSSSRA